MPGFVPTPLGEQAEAAIDILGNRIRVAILGYLASDGPAQRREIAAALALVPGSVSNQLTVLLDVGMVTTEPAPDQIRPGVRVKYAVQPDRVAEIHKALGHALGLDLD